MSKKQNLTLAILLSNLFIAFLGIGLVIPVLPTIMNELNISGSVVGYMVAAFAITQLIVSPIAGKLVDKIGRKIMIVVGLFIFGLSELLFGFGRSVEVLFISRMLGGVSAAFIMPAVTAYIADITTLSQRPKALGYMSAAISTGFIIGPGIGGFLAAIFSIVLLKEPTRASDDEESAPSMLGSVKRIFSPLYLIPFVLIFVLSFGLAAFESLFSLFVDHKFAFTPSDIAIIITGSGIVGALAQLLLFDGLIKKMGEINLIRVSLVLSAVLTFAMTFVSHYFAILFVTFFIFVGFDLIRPAVTSYLSKIAGNEQGFVGGMNSMFTSLGNIFGPILGGILFDINLNYPYYFATIVLALGVILALFWKKPKHIEI